MELILNACKHLHAETTKKSAAGRDCNYSTWFVLGLDWACKSATRCSSSYFIVHDTQNSVAKKLLLLLSLDLLLWALFVESTH
jgi:hypothetical protein